MFHVIIVHPTVSVTMKDLKKNNKIWDGSETHVIIRVTVSKSRIKIKNRISLRKKVDISWRHQRWFPRSEERAQNLQTDDVSLARSG